MSEPEFVAWVDDKTRAEWVDGEVIVMAAVNVDHDQTTFWARSVVSDFVEFRDLGIVTSDVPVRLPKLKSRRAPDVAFVSKARAHLVHKTHIEGPPDLVMEVVSPDSVSRDWQQKYIAYAKAGVREYWVIDRLAGQMEAYTLRPSGRVGGTFRQIEEADGKLASVVLKGFYLRADWVLGNWRTSRRAASKELGIA